MKEQSELDFNKLVNEIIKHNPKIEGYDLKIKKLREGLSKNNDDLDTDSDTDTDVEFSFRVQQKRKIPQSIYK